MMKGYEIVSASHRTPEAQDDAEQSLLRLWVEINFAVDRRGAAGKQGSDQLFWYKPQVPSADSGGINSEQFD
jgi:hypothetical protein